MSVLELGVKSQLGDQNPAAVWSLLESLVSQAFENYPDEAEKLLQKYDTGLSEEKVSLILQHLDPVVGFNNLVAVNSSPKLDLKNLLKTNPPDVLEKVLFMVTLSSKWQSEVAT